MKVTYLISFLIVLFTAMAIPAWADDTDIFSVSEINVPPNVLIIFDTSNTMLDAIPLIQYYNTTDYGAKLGGSPYEMNKVYYVWKEPSQVQEDPIFRMFPEGEKTGFEPSEFTCSDTADSLSTLGRWMGRIQSSPEPTTDGDGNPVTGFPCGGDTVMKLYTGNYLNFMDYIETLDPTTFPSETKLDSAVEVINELMESMEMSATSPIVRLGMMRYDKEHQGQGGRIIAEIGSTQAQIESAMQTEILDQKSDTIGATPIAECLAEAGLYYGGKNSWSNKGVTYTSPIQWRCQKNYVILMTDGLSTGDEGINADGYDIINNVDKHGIALTGYFGKAIGNYDGDTGADPGTDANGGTHWLDDIAKFLHDEDLLVSPATDDAGQSFDDENWSKQSVITYAIGFAIGTDYDLLKSATDVDHGNGQSWTAGNKAQLEIAFQRILGKIIEMNSSFIAPVVPVNKLNKVYSGNSVYLSLFQPKNELAFWMGNIKKFGLDSDGNLLQKDGSPATDADGQILYNSTSCWNSIQDGSKTDEGGAGEVLYNQSSRHFYTYDTSSASTTDLTDSSNAFSTTNAAITGTVLGVDAADKDDLINFLTARGSYAKDATYDREWVLGDILHSKPTTMFYNDYTIIFAGANDGFLHVFVDDDNGTNDSPSDLSDDTLSEAWCFVPWDLVPNLYQLKTGSQHQYYVDGSPLLFKDGGYQYVTFGLRRGGNKYYTLKVGQLDGDGDYNGGYTAPTFEWEIASDVLGSSSEQLGQSWCKPWLSTIAQDTSTTNNVLLITGGYDADNEDLDSPAAGDSKGRAVFAVDATTGAIQTNFNFNHGTETDMDYCIVELIAFDFNNNGIDDTVYAGDLGGNLFGFSDRNEDGTWTKSHVFQARSAAAGTENSLLKFFTSPDVALELFGDYVYIGTGDRAHPSGTTTVDRFYAIKNTWSSTWTTLTEVDLVDVTSYTYTTEQLADLQTGNGWYIKFNERSGEKIVSSPLLFNKMVFFTTFTPQASTSVADKCAIGGLGGGRLYALDYLTGKAAMNFDTTSDDLTKSDRSMFLGVGIPSPPTLIVTETGGAKLIIGTGGTGGSGGGGGTTGARTIDIPGGSDVNLYYWKQI